MLSEIEQMCDCRSSSSFLNMSEVVFVSKTTIEVQL